jgi:malonyl CoA-acyl carrier protein transacylase
MTQQRAYAEQALALVREARSGAAGASQGPLEVEAMRPTIIYD